MVFMQCPFKHHPKGILSILVQPWPTYDDVVDMENWSLHQRLTQLGVDCGSENMSPRFVWFYRPVQGRRPGTEAGGYHIPFWGSALRHGPTRKLLGRHAAALSVRKPDPWNPGGPEKLPLIRVFKRNPRSCTRTTQPGGFVRGRKPFYPPHPLTSEARGILAASSNAPPKRGPMVSRPLHRDDTRSFPAAPAEWGKHPTKGWFMDYHHGFLMSTLQGRASKSPNPNRGLPYRL